MAWDIAKPQQPSSNNAAQGGRGQGEERPKTMFWLNVGMSLPVPNAETGETEEVFVSLPMGIPLDGLKEQHTSSSNENFRQLVAAKNWLLKTIKDKAESMEAGEAELVNGLEIQLKRVSEETTGSTAGNPLLEMMQNRFTRVAGELEAAE